MAFKDPAKRRAYEKKYRAENKELYRRIRRARQLRTKEYVRKFKDVPCADCKKSYPFYVMDFDHRDGSQKSFSIGNYLARSAAKGNHPDLDAEIAKCDVVCANCHRERTQKRLVSTK